MGYYLIPSTIMFLLVIKHIISKSGSKASHSKTLLELEAEANQTRKQDISKLPYISIPMDTLPFHRLTPAPDAEQKIISLEQKPILNLNGITNTELKKQYGPANLEFLSQCDDNFTTLIRSLGLWAKCFLDSNMLPEAKIVLEYSISIGSDIRNTYEMLTDIYFEEQDTAALKQLRSTGEQLSSLSAPGILSYIDSFLA